MNTFNNNTAKNNNGTFMPGYIYIEDIQSGSKKCLGSIYTRANPDMVAYLLSLLASNPQNVRLVYEDRNNNIPDNTFLGQAIVTWNQANQPAPAPAPQAPAQAPVPQAPQVQQVQYTMPAPQPQVVQAPAPQGNAQPNIQDIPF